MAVRAVILGLLGAAVVCGVTYFNDQVMQQTMFVGNNMPYSVYGGLILFLLFLNPAITYVKRRWAFTGAELAVVLCLTLAACSIPGSGLMRTMTNALMMPRHMASTRPGWQSEEVIEMAPDGMLAGTPPRLRPDDVLDPRGLCLAMMRDGEGEATGPPSRVGERIWDFLSDADREAIEEAARRALAGPDRAACARAEAAVARVLEKELERARRQEEEEKEKRREEKEEEKKAKEKVKKHRLSPADRDEIAGAVRQALAPPGSDSPGTAEKLRALDSMLKRRGVSDGGREDVSAAVRRAIEPTERPCRAAAVRALNGILDGRGLYRPDVFEGVTLPAEADRILDREVRLSLPEGEELPPGERRLPDRIESLSERDVRTLNRHLIDSAWPKEIYAHVQRRDDEIKGFVLGLDPIRGRVSLEEVPWSAWKRPLVFWTPLILLLWIGLIGLAVVVHRQWSRHEQLSYPIARFAGSLLPAEGEAKGGVFRNHLFWLAAATILVIHLTNYAYVWKPNSLVRIPTLFDFRSLTKLFPTLERGGAGWRVFRLHTYFTVVAVAYFVASDVSLSLGIGPIIYCYVAGLLAGYGVSIGGGGFYAPNIEKMSAAGAYFGILIMILYTGRRYYANVFRRAVFLKPKEEVEAQAAWGARVFIVCATLFTVDLALAGLDWQFAVFYTLAAVVMFLVMGRIIAETGLFFIQPIWYPGAMLVGFLGVRAVGPTTGLFMFLVSSVILIDPREALMPFVVNSLKLLEVRRVHIGRTAIWTGAAVVLGLAVAVPVTLMFQHGAGTGRVDRWSTDLVPRFAFDQTVRMKQRLKAQDALSEAESVSGWSRLAHVKPEGKAVIGFCAGLAAVLAFSAARLRLPWWPLHPILFIVWSRYAGYKFAFSFLLGWFIKTIITKYGGEKAYTRLKPVFFGLIAGDMLGGIIPSLVGAVYYLVTGEVPKPFMVMPH